MGLCAAAKRFCMRVSDETSYTTQYQTLPYEFTQIASTKQQETSLRLHGEKKALADLLEHGSDALDIGKNFKVCVDCHEFMKGASAMLKRRITVREPKMKHQFDNGACS